MLVYCVYYVSIGFQNLSSMKTRIPDTLQVLRIISSIYEVLYITGRNEWMKPCDEDKCLINMQGTGFLVQKTHFPNRKVLELSRRKRKETQKRTLLRSHCVTFLVDRPGCQKQFVWGVGACSCHSQESEQSCVDQVACLLRRAGISWCGVRCLP